VLAAYSEGLANTPRPAQSGGRQCGWTPLANVQGLLMFKNLQILNIPKATLDLQTAALEPPIATLDMPMLILGLPISGTIIA
jgi:hypothetical protein